MVRAMLRRSFYSFVKGITCANHNPNLLDDETFAESCHWIQRKLIMGKKRMWFGDPRGHTKSTRVTESLPGWLAIQKPDVRYDLVSEFDRYKRLKARCGILKGPDTRILIASATKPNAQDFVLQNRRLFEGNTLFRWAFPELCPEAHNQDSKPRWSSECFDIPGRTMNYGEGFLNAGSPESTETKYHYDLIIGDDFIHEGNYLSIIETQAAIRWVSLSESLLDNQDVTSPLSSVLLWIGNFWTHYDLRSHVEAHLRDDYDIWHRACWECSVHGKGNCDRGQLCTFTSKPLWNVKFSKSGLESQRRRQGNKIFSAQMENNPLDPESLTFKPENLFDCLLDKNEGVINVFQHNADIFVKRVSLADCWFFAVLDPATSDDPLSCRSAFLVCAEDSEGMVHIIGGFAEQLKPETSMTKLLDTWLWFYRKGMMIRTVGIEGNAGQRWAVSTMCVMAKYRAATNRADAALSYLQEPPKNNNDDRIKILNPDRGVAKRDRISNGLGARSERRMLSLALDLTFREVFLYEYGTFPSAKSIDTIDAAAYIEKIARGNMQSREALELNMARYWKRRVVSSRSRGRW
jgi:hypothetical protein